MRNLLLFLARNNRFIIFIMLETVAVLLIANSFKYHNSRLLKNVRKATLAWEEIITDTRNYFRIKKINSDLQAENTALKNLIEKLQATLDEKEILSDSALKSSDYEYIPALVVNNSVNKLKNFFTINRGTDDSVNVDMAVISPWGVAGIIVASSRNFSVVMPLINTDFRLSCKLLSSDFFGSLSWEGFDCRYALLSDIPQHVPLMQGDTIVTTGYSAIFPGNIMVGTVSNFEKTGSDFYRIRVRLSTEFRRLTHVMVIKNRKREEQITLEAKFQ